MNVRPLQAFACLTLASLLLTEGAHSQDSNASCAHRPSAILLSNRATLDAETRLYKIESTNASTLNVTAHEMDPGTGTPGRPLWRSQVLAESLRDSAAPHSAAPAIFDATLIGPPRFHLAKDASDKANSRFIDTAAKRSQTLYVTTQDGRIFSLNTRNGQSAQVGIPQSDLDGHDPIGATLTTGEVQVQGAWRTTLVVLTQGNPAILYGIDVTDPDAPKMLWSQSIQINGERRDGERRPAIVQSKEGWSVMFTAGNVLHIHNAITGAEIRAIKTDEGQHALTDPAATDVDRDGIAERVYAGDTKGNLWRFDLSSNDPQRWQIAFGGSPLVTATDTEGSSAQVSHRPEVAVARDARTPIVIFTARSSSGVALFGAPDRNRWLEPRFTSKANSGLLAWRHELGAVRDLLDVSPPRIIDRHVVLTLKQRTLASCDARASLVAFSIDEGQEQPNLPFLTAIADATDHGEGRVQEVVQGASRPVILEQLTLRGNCLRHYYIGTATDRLLHEKASCRDDTFGRQSWRQLR